MHIKIPSEIVLEGIGYDVGHIAAHQCDMMLESIAANVLHQLLEVIDLRHGDAAVHSVGIVRNLAFAYISADPTGSIVGRNAEEGEVSLADLGIDGAKGTYLAKGATQNAEWSKLEVVVSDEGPREITTVCADALVAVVGEVVVPVGQGRSVARSKAESQHRHSTCDVGFAGARDAHISEHGHGDTGCAAIVLLQRVPALQGESINLVGLDPSLDGHSELGLHTQLLLIGSGHLGVGMNIIQLLKQSRIVVSDLLCGKQNLRQVGRNNGDTAALEELLAGTTGVEAERACADLANAAMTQASYDAADASELVHVLLELLAIDAVSVETGEGEGDAILIEVIADRNLAAESIATAIQINLVVVVVAGLNQHGHIEFGTEDGVDDANLIAEIGKTDQNTVDLIAVGAEELRILDAVLKRLDGTGARWCSIFGKDDIFVALLVERLEQLFLNVSCEF